MSDLVKGLEEARSCFTEALKRGHPNGMSTLRLILDNVASDMTDGPDEAWLLYQDMDIAVESEELSALELLDRAIQKAKEQAE